MLSRVADSIYWMSRYVERAENVARFIEVNLQLMLDAPVGESQQWLPLVNTTGDHEEFAQRVGEASQQNVIHFLTFDPGNPNSILSCVRAARENARTVREIISSEMWLALNKFYLMVTAAADHQTEILANPHDFFTEVKNANHLFNGIAAATMTHGEGWHFFMLGRMLERADRPFDAYEVRLLSADDRRLVADGIRARSGRASPVPEHDRVFAKLDWYHPLKGWTEARLTDVDRENIAMVDAVGACATLHSDDGTQIQRRASKAPPAQGGWNVIFNWFAELDRTVPLPK